MANTGGFGAPNERVMGRFLRWLYPTCNICGKGTRGYEHFYDADRDGCYVEFAPGAADFVPRA